MSNDPFFQEISDDEPQERIRLTTYRVSFEISIADTNAAPSDWLPSSIYALLEEGESLSDFKEEEINE